jgi:hypothetical protein
MTYPALSARLPSTHTLPGSWPQKTTPKARCQPHLNPGARSWQELVPDELECITGSMENSEIIFALLYLQAICDKANRGHRRTLWLTTWQRPFEPIGKPDSHPPVPSQLPTMGRNCCLRKVVDKTTLVPQQELPSCLYCDPAVAIPPYPEGEIINREPSPLHRLADLAPPTMLSGCLCLQALGSWWPTRPSSLAPLPHFSSDRHPISCSTWAAHMPHCEVRVSVLSLPCMAEDNTLPHP